MAWDPLRSSPWVEAKRQRGAAEEDDEQFAPDPNEEA
jgi:hypothetical protein